MIEAFRTKFGVSLNSTAEEALESRFLKKFANKIDLIFTSPPFPLNRKKKYGNLQGQQYIDWLASFGQRFSHLLKPDGSIVVEVGNSWEPGRPIMSTLALRSLLEFLDQGELFLCQQFIYNNPARLPSPAQWVNVERIRVKDSYTHLWWMSKTDRPKANNRNVLKEYSDSMKNLIKTKKYNAGRRPSEHHIGLESFLTDNNGAIPSNVLTFSNTQAGTEYLRYCRDNDLNPHPARMPQALPEFFIKFLTEKGDLVLDPFAGSNTTGAAAESLDRRWISIEPNAEYIQSSRGRFPSIL